MAYFYRNPQSPRDEPPVPVYTHPLSPQRNPNRLSAGMMPTVGPQDVRGGLTRRFTTNALPTLSPIGQQRKQAAGDYAVSGAIVTLRDVCVGTVCGSGSGSGNGSGNGNGDHNREGRKQEICMIWEQDVHVVPRVQLWSSWIIQGYF